MQSTAKRVRYPDPVSDGLFKVMEDIDGNSLSKVVSTQLAAKLEGLRSRGLVNASNGLTPVGKQFLQMRRDLEVSRARLAERNRAARTERLDGLKDPSDTTGRVRKN